MVEQLDAWVRALGPWLYPALFAAAMIEYLTPPFPGDTVMLLGGAGAARGEGHWLPVFVAITLGSITGLSLNWLLGRWLAKRFHGPQGWRLPFGLPSSRLDQAMAAVREKGAWFIAGNRFLPTFRAVLFIAAGAAELPYRRVVLLGSISVVLWNALLLAAGWAVGGNAEELMAWFERYQRGALWAAGGAVVVFVAWKVWRHRPGRGSEAR